MKISRITLGTAQLGLNYGISNTEGKPDKAKGFKILKKAVELGINSFDTAAAYGNSEDLLGDFLSNNDSIERSFITTKIPSIRKSKASGDSAKDFIQESAESSVRKLRNPISNYLVHDFGDYVSFKDELRDVVQGLKERGIVERFGISLYEPQEAEEVIEDDFVDSVQIPLSVLNQTFLKKDLLKRLKTHNKLVFARSVFLQGLVFLGREDLERRIPEAVK